MDAAEPEEVQVRGDGPGRLGGRGAARGDRVLEQPAAKDEHVDRWVLGQGRGRGRAVRDHRAVEVGRQRLDHGQRGGAAVQDQRAARLDQGGGPGRDTAFAVRLDAGPGAVVGQRR